MPSAAKKSSKPAARPAAKPAARPAARPAATGGSKAAQAAASQGRPAPAQAEKPAAVPAVRQDTRPPADPATLASLPAFMRNDADMGKEAIGQEDIQIPRLKLMQGLSPELQEYNELRAGDFFHPAAEFIFNEPFRAVVVHMDRRYILWRPRDSGGGILARADDGIHWSPSQGTFDVTLDKKDGGVQVKWTLAPTVAQSGLANWGTMNPADSNSPPAATLMYNYLLAFPEEPDLMPAVLSFQRTSIKVGRNFNTKIKTIRTPIFGTVWEFGSKEETNARGQKFFNIDVKGAGVVEDASQYEMYKAMHLQFAHAGISIKDVEGMQGDAEEAELVGSAAGTPAY